MPLSGERHHRQYRNRRCKCLARSAVLVGLLLLTACQSAVEYKVDEKAVAGLSRQQAANFLGSLRGGRHGAHLRPDYEHCHFTPQGLRIALADPQYVQTIVDAQQQELRDIVQDRETLARDTRKITEEQRSVEAWLRARGRPSLAEEQRKFADEQRDFEHWLQVRGKPNVAAEKRKMEEEHRDAERWLRLRGMPPGQIERAKAEMAKEKVEFDPRYAASLAEFEAEKRNVASWPSQIAAEMEQERNTLAGRRRDLDTRQQKANTTIAEARARVHDIVPYRNAGFVVTEVLGVNYYIDIDYRVPATGRTESCGLRLVPGDGATPEIRQQVVNALAALGAEPQHGTSAKPPVR